MTSDTRTYRDDIRVGVSEVQSYAQGIAHHRKMMVVLGLAGTLALVVSIRFTLVSPLFTSLDTLIFVAALSIYAPCTALLFVCKDRHLYYIVVPWIIIAASLCLALVLNSLFGSNSSRLLQDQVPVYLAFIPVIIVFAYTYLTTTHATIVCGIYAVAMAVAGCGFTLMAWPQSITSPSVIFLLMTFLIANPAVMIMMHLTRVLNLEANQYLERMLKHERRKHAADLKLQQTDPVTLTLNLDGAVHSLQRHLDKQSLSGGRLLLCSLVMDSVGTPAGNASSMKWGKILQTISTALKGMLGPETVVARTGGTQFLIWNDPIAYVDKPNNTGSRLLNLLGSLQLGLQPVPSFSIGITQAMPGQTAETLIEAANFQAFLAQSRGGGQFCVDESA